MSKTFTVITPMTDGRGRNWLDMKPGHFDERELPRTRKAPEGQNELFSVADIAPVKARPAKTAAELDGQADLFSD